MKLSDFNRDRELEFYVDEEGKESTRVIEPITKGKVKFHSISKDLLDKLNSVDIKREKNYDELVYKLMDILTDIKKDIPLEQFKSMLLYPPSDSFIQFIEEINSEFISLMDRFNKFKDSIEQINKKIANMPDDIKKEFEKAQMTDEELLEGLKKEYDAAEDPKAKDEILDKMMDLKAAIKNQK